MYIRTMITETPELVPLSQLHQYFDGEIDNSPFSYCDKCECLKPFRCHHCRVCNSCVYRMDHHCVWVGRCIGIHNVRFFILFIFSLSFSLLFGAFTSFPLPSLSYSTKLLFTFECILGVGLLIFSLAHLFMLCTNQTSLEVSDNISDYIHQPSHLRRFITPYDLGVSVNVHQVLRFCSYWELLNPFAAQALVDPMKVIVSREYIVHSDLVDAEKEGEL